jgi:tetratricopeptide (TPR) repeat protein
MWINCENGRRITFHCSARARSMRWNVSREELSELGSHPRARMRPAGYEPEQLIQEPEKLAQDVVAPGGIQVQLLLLELLELVTSLQSNSIRQLGVLQRWSGRLAELGILDDAHDRCQDALALIRERGLDKGDEIDMLQQLAMIYREAGLARRAVTTFEHVLAFDEQAGDRLGIARSTGNLAGAWSAAGDYERALQLHQAAIQHFMDCAEDPRFMVPALRGVAIELLNAGLTLEKLHRARDALEHLEQSISTLHGLSRSIPDGFARELTTALLASARCASQLGLLDQAQAAASEAANLAARAGFRTANTMTGGNTGGGVVVVDACEEG